MSELALTLGNTTAAMRDAETAVAYADRHGEPVKRMLMRTTQADAMHQAGRALQALALFEVAEHMQVELRPDVHYLYSVQGFQFCDLLLAPAERAAWQACQPGTQPTGSGLESALGALGAVAKRATQALAWAMRNRVAWLTIALDHLTLGRVAHIESILAWTPSAAARQSLDQAVEGLHLAGSRDHLPRGLLARAWYRHRAGHPTGPNSAQTDLDEAWTIAARGPMPLFQADIHLHRARLFGPHCGGPGQPPYPWTSSAHDLQEGRRLTDKHGYGRRLEELQDAEAAAPHWPGHGAVSGSAAATPAGAASS